MGLLWFAIKLLVIFAIVITAIGFAWPHIEPILPGVRTTVTGMFTAMESLK